MNEAMERAKFMKKPFAIAKSSRQYIEKLCKIGIDVSKFGTIMVSSFSSILSTIAKTVMQAMGFSRGIRGLSLTRFMFLPPSGLWSRRVTLPEEEYFQTEMGGANISFLFNVTMARKTAAELARRAVAKTPKPALLPESAPLPEAELIKENLEERLEEPPKTVPHIVADLQSRFKIKLAPSIKSISAALQEYGRQTILLAPLLGMFRPSSVGPPRLEGPPSLPVVAPPEKEAAQVSLPEKPLAVISQVSSPSYEEARVEPQLPSAKPPIRMTEPPVSARTRIPVERLKQDVASSLEYATELSGIVLEREIPILKRMAAFSLVSRTKPPLPSIEPPYRYPGPTTLPSMRPSQIGRLLEEISPSLTSWIYGVSEVLRGTSLSLSAVPVAASTAEKVVTEALIQPVSSFKAPGTLGTQQPVSHGLTTFRPETGVRRTEVEAFRLPAIVTSLIVALSQRYPLLFSEPTISEAYGTPYELARVVPEEKPALGRMQEVKSFSKLPTVIALAAAESLIAYRLQHEFSALIRQIHVARSSSGERLSGLSTFGPIRPTILGKLAAAAPATPLSSTLEPYAPGIPPRARSRLESVSPAIQNTFNITISAESAEEDLRDLERKISKILSEQMRRYYGSPRI